MRWEGERPREPRMSQPRGLEVRGIRIWSGLFVDSQHAHGLPFGTDRDPFPLNPPTANCPVPYPFSPVAAIPWMNSLWVKKNRTITGATTTVEAAMSRCHSAACLLL